MRDCTRLTSDTNIYNDFAGYGVQEVIENQLLHYSQAKTLEERWMAVTGLTYFLSCCEIGPWYMQDDGERTAATASMIGLTVLHALSMMAKAKELKPNNHKFKDIALVIANVLELVKAWEVFEHSGLDGHDVEADSEEEDEESKVYPWPEIVFSYAHHYGVVNDVEAVPFLNTAEYTALFANAEASVWPEKKMKQADGSHWKYRTRFAAFKKRYGKNAKGEIGGKKYDITSWPSYERAELCYDKKDPIPPKIRRGLAKGRKIWME